MSTYPVTFEADFVEKRSRLTTFFRAIMVIPHFIWAIVYGTLAWFAVLLAWFAIIFTGRYPQGLYDFVAGFTRWATQLNAYFYLLTDAYPPFWGNVEEDYPIRMRFAGPLEKYSRLKTFFRGILAIPIAILRYYVIGPLVSLGALAAWFVVLVLGRMPQGLQQMLELGSSYAARSDAYLFLLTETYPPFQDDAGALAAAPGGAALSGGAGGTAVAAPTIPSKAPEQPDS